MDKQKLVMVSSKVLNQMLAYRRHNRYFASYKEACESIGTEIEKFRSDAFRTNISYYAQSSPRLFSRSFQNQLVNIAAKCLLTIAECSGEHLLYDDLFDSLFSVTGEMLTEYSEDDNQHYDNKIINKFEDFEAGVSSSYANTVLLYQIVVNCLFLFQYIDAKSNSFVDEEKQCTK